jgi:glycosyltransferase involved in cell wall biosynthesis
MKILWHGVPAEYGTGYGVQTGLFTKALRNLGHELAVSSVCSTPCKTDINGFRVYAPGPRGGMGNDMILGHVNDFKPDIVLSCMDSFAVDAEKFAKFWWACWHVIDSAPLMPEIADRVPHARTRLAMSRFGQRVMEKAGYDAEYVPLAIDTATFRPMEHSARKAARERIGKLFGRGLPFGDTFYIVMNSANMSIPSRKNFYGALAAFTILLRAMKEQGREAVLYIHTDPTGNWYNGEDIVAMAQSLGIPKANLFFPPVYQYVNGELTQEHLRDHYCAADVFLHTARGEGFGLPIIEAMACGCPVVMPNNSSMTEFGECDPDLIVSEQVPFCSSRGTVQWIVEPAAVAARLMKVAADPVLFRTPERQRERAEFTDQYDIARVAADLSTVLLKSYSKHEDGMNAFSGTTIDKAFPDMSNKVQINDRGTLMPGFRM